MTEQELRRTFHDRLAELQHRVTALISRVALAVPEVTEALLGVDGQRASAAAQILSAVPGEVDHVEGEVFDLVATQAPVARDLRFLVASLRIAHEVALSASLIEAIANRAPSIDARRVTPELRQLIAGMGGQATQMFRIAAAAYAVLDHGIASEAGPSQGAEAVHRSVLRAILDAPECPVEMLVELALVARFYARLADHAADIAARVRFVAERV